MRSSMKQSVLEVNDRAVCRRPSSGQAAGSSPFPFKIRLEWLWALWAVERLRVPVRRQHDLVRQVGHHLAEPTPHRRIGRPSKRHAKHYVSGVPHRYHLLECGLSRVVYSTVSVREVELGDEDAILRVLPSQSGDEMEHSRQAPAVYHLGVGLKVEPVVDRVLRVVD